MADEDDLDFIDLTPKFGLVKPRTTRGDYENDNLDKLDAHEHEGGGSSGPVEFVEWSDWISPSTLVAPQDGGSLLLPASGAGFVHSDDYAEVFDITTIESTGTLLEPSSCCSRVSTRSSMKSCTTM